MDFFAENSSYWKNKIATFNYSNLGDSEVWKSLEQLQNVINNRNLIENFRISHLIDGSLNPPERPSFITSNFEELSTSKLSVKNQTKNFWQMSRFYFYLLRHSFKNHGFIFFPVKPFLIGNPKRTSIFLRFSESNIRYSYYSALVLRIINKESKVVLEIGGGFGYLTAILLNSKRIKKMVLIDLPINLYVTEYFLTCAGFKVARYETYESYLVGDCQVLLLTPSEIEIITNANFFINTMSFQHMTRSDINKYFDLLNRLPLQGAYMVNRKTLRDASDVLPSNYPPLKFLKLKFKSIIFSSDHEEKIYSN